MHIDAKAAMPSKTPLISPSTPSTFDTGYLNETLTLVSISLFASPVLKKPVPPMVDYAISCPHSRWRVTTIAPSLSLCYLVAKRLVNMTLVTSASATERNYNAQNENIEGAPVPFLF